MEYVYEYNCSTEDETVKIGQELAKIAKKGDVFLLDGTLGMGKTVLARAFIQKLTGAKEVPSPTFTLLQSYPAKECEVYHYDLYRIKKAMEIFELGIEEAMYTGISIIEWPEKMENFRPLNAFNIKISPKPNDDKARIIKIKVTSEEKSSRLKSMEV